MAVKLQLGDCYLHVPSLFMLSTSQQQKLNRVQSTLFASSPVGNDEYGTQEESLPSNFKRNAIMGTSADDKISYTRRRLFNILTSAAFGYSFVATSYDRNDNNDNIVANAAPPFAVIAEELGYFPIQNPKTGELVYVSKRISRESSKQAIELATILNKKGVVLAGTYWCPHTIRQKELLGKEAFANIRYLECSSKGYLGNPSVCMAQKVEGYPTWLFPDGTQISGERPLSVLAEAVGMKNFKEELEDNMPIPLGAKACQ